MTLPIKLEDFYEADTVTISIPVTDGATGAAKMLTGGTAVVLAAPATGGASIALPNAVSGSSITVSIAANTLAAGVWIVQARASLGLDVQTVTEFIIPSKKSLV